MTQEVFEKIVVEEWKALPERFARLVNNVALLIEDEPSAELCLREGLGEGETLLGLYHGIPHTERGSEYGVGGVLPDTITLFRLPLLEEAGMLAKLRGYSEGEAVRIAVRETLWHEIAHYFGMEEGEVATREDEGKNHFAS